MNQAMFLIELLLIFIVVITISVWGYLALLNKAVEYRERKRKEKGLPPTPTLYDYFTKREITIIIKREEPIPSKQ